MHRILFRTISRICWLSALTLILAGCPATAPSDLPPELSRVMADAAMFRQVADDPAPSGGGGVPAALPADELCLGAFSENCQPSGAVCQRLWQAIHLEPGTQELTRYTADNLFGVSLVVDIWYGHYTVLELGHLRFEVRRVESNFPAGSPFSDITGKFDSLPVYDVYLTEAEQGIRVEFRMPADDVRTPAGFLDNIALVHRSFACPE